MSRDQPRPLLFKNCNQRFPPLAKGVAPVSLYQNIVPTKCLRNQLEMVRSITIGRFNWCSLTSASPPLTKIIDRRKTFIDLASFRTISSHFLDLLKENGLLSFWWEFRLKGLLDKTGRGWSRVTVMIGLKLLVKGYLENTVRCTTPL